MKRQFSIFQVPFSNDFSFKDLKTKWQMANGKWQISRGFTLIEALLVLTLIGVIAAGLLITFNPFDQIRKANDARRKADLASVQRALEVYYQDFGSYPQSSGDYRIMMNSVTISWGGAWAPYASKLPADPLPSNRYVYYSPPSSNGQTYYLYANLERGRKDSQVCNLGNACTSMSLSGFPAASACGGTCNYGASSSNVAP